MYRLDFPWFSRKLRLCKRISHLSFFIPTDICDMLPFPVSPRIRVCKDRINSQLLVHILILFRLFKIIFPHIISPVFLYDLNFREVIIFSRHCSGIFFGRQISADGIVKGADRIAASLPICSHLASGKLMCVTIPAAYTFCRKWKCSFIFLIRLCIPEYFQPALPCLILLFIHIQNIARIDPLIFFVSP